MRATEPEATSQSRVRARIALVEPYACVREALRSVLERLGYEVTSGPAMQLLAARSLPDVALVAVADDGSGVSDVVRLRAWWPSVPVLALLDRGSRQAVDRVHSAGASGWIPRDASATTMALVLDGVGQTVRNAS